MASYANFFKPISYFTLLIKSGKNFRYKLPLKKTTIFLSGQLFKDDIRLPLFHRCEILKILQLPVLSLGRTY